MENQFLVLLCGRLRQVYKDTANTRQNKKHKISTKEEPPWNGQ